MSDLDRMSIRGLLDNISRGLRTEATDRTRARGRAALVALRPRLVEVQRKADRHTEEHRDDRYDGLA